MEFKQLEAFVAVVDYKSFSEAAKHLYLIPYAANYQCTCVCIRKRTEFPSAHPYHQTDESYRPWNAAL